METAPAVGNWREGTVHIPGGRIEVDDEVIQNRGWAAGVETDVGEVLFVEHDVTGIAASERLADDPGSWAIQFACKVKSFVRCKEATLRPVDSSSHMRHEATSDAIRAAERSRQSRLQEG
jgi:hypothetical protein